MSDKKYLKAIIAVVVVLIITVCVGIAYLIVSNSYNTGDILTTSSSDSTGDVYVASNRSEAESSIVSTSESNSVSETADVSETDVSETTDIEEENDPETDDSNVSSGDVYSIMNAMLKETSSDSEASFTDSQNSTIEMLEDMAGIEIERDTVTIDNSGLIGDVYGAGASDWYWYAEEGNYHGIHLIRALYYGSKVEEIYDEDRYQKFLKKSLYIISCPESPYRDMLDTATYEVSEAKDDEGKIIVVTFKFDNGVELGLGYRYGWEGAYDDRNDSDGDRRLPFYIKNKPFDDTESSDGSLSEKDFIYAIDRGSLFLDEKDGKYILS